LSKRHRHWWKRFQRTGEYLVVGGSTGGKNAEGETKGRSQSDKYLGGLEREVFEEKRTELITQQKKIRTRISLFVRLGGKKTEGGEKRKENCTS